MSTSRVNEGLQGERVVTRILQSGVRRSLQEEKVGYLLVQNSLRDHTEVLGETILQYGSIRLMWEWNIHETLFECKHNLKKMKIRLLFLDVLFLICPEIPHHYSFLFSFCPREGVYVVGHIYSLFFRVPSVYSFLFSSFCHGIPCNLWLVF